MLPAEELEELRSLQARAYGRDAVLTDADALRLRELQARRVAPAPEAAEHEPAEPRVPSPSEPPSAERAPAGAGGGDASVLVAPETDDGGPESAEAHGDETPSSPAPSLWSLLRTRWRPVAIAAVAVLLVGLGVGWLAFGRSGVASVELTAEQQEWQDDLISGGVYDAGSVHALAVEEGVVVWAATKDSRARTCVILSTGAVSLPSCDRTDRVAETGIYGSITVGASDDLQRQVNVQMLLTATGDPAVAVTAYDYDPVSSGITYANEQEADTAARLVEEGFDASSLWVVGYDGEVPVWNGVQVDSQNRCLIHDGSTPESPMTCADPETMQEQASSLVLNVVDTDTGAVTHLEMGSAQGPAYLVITREGGVGGAGGD
jgi:hypothetical protein